MIGRDVDPLRTDTSVVDGAPTGATSARLLVEETGRPPRVVVVPVGAEVRVGRSATVEVSLDDTRVSREHAVIRFDGRAVLVRDEASSNGTFVDGARITGTRAADPGAVITIGSTRIVVVASSRDSVRPETHGPVVGTVASGSDVVAVDPAMVSLLALVRRLAASDLPVLVQGETGSGKEVVARLLHRYSRRAGRSFLGVNCAALPESLAESELFGHERGSFTGADARKGGVFERADGGTLLLDEVGELSSTNQARLLRVLQERTLTRVGGTTAVPVDVRVVAATNRDLLVDVAKGRFREDLYFRLNGVTVAVPPLRSRPRDIVPMAERVLAERGGGWHLGQGVAAVLQSYRWPGNVRELRNAIECAIALAEGAELRVEHLPPAVRGDVEPAAAVAAAAAGAGGDEPSGLRTKVDELERRSILAALDAAGWNQSRAAQNLGISRRGLIYKMERHGLKARPVSGHGE
jgi:transcriptional regulator with GAF, ATPase, and Fis domain